MKNHHQAARVETDCYDDDGGGDDYTEFDKDADYGNEMTFIYFQSFFQSLSQRNKELMKEKKRLLIINKVEIERLEKEKVKF